MIGFSTFIKVVCWFGNWFRSKKSSTKMIVSNSVSDLTETVRKVSFTYRCRWQVQVSAHHSRSGQWKRRGAKWLEEPEPDSVSGIHIRSNYWERQFLIIIWRSLVSHNQTIIRVLFVGGNGARSFRVMHGHQTGSTLWIYLISNIQPYKVILDKILRVTRDCYWRLT